MQDSKYIKQASDEPSPQVKTTDEVLEVDMQFMIDSMKISEHLTRVLKLAISGPLNKLQEGDDVYRDFMAMYQVASRLAENYKDQTSKLEELRKNLVILFTTNTTH